MKDLKILERLDEVEKRLSILEEENKKEYSSKKERNQNSTVLYPTEMEEGILAYTGKYKSQDGKIGSSFGAERVEINKLLKGSSFEMAKVIDAFSSEERIDIIKQLMKQNLRAKGLMERLSFTTTGKLYHHLSYLEKLGIVAKNGDQYHIVSRYISCIVLIFAGVNKIVDRNSQEEN